MPLEIPAESLLRWNDESARHWREFLLANPTIFDLPCDIGRATTVSTLLRHIVAVELRYAQRLASQPESSYDEVPCDSPEALFATHDRALQLVRSVLADPAYDWSQEIEFQTISAGRIRAPRRAIFIHLLMHSIRHYAQLATLARTHGFKPSWFADYLLVEAHPV